MSEIEYPSIKPVEAPRIAPDEPKQEKRSDTPRVVTFEPAEKPIELGYIKELFDLGESATHFEMPKLCDEIDEFILSEIKRQGMSETRKSYEELIAGYTKTLKIPNGIDNYTKIEKVAELIRINKKMIEAMVAKEELLNGDPTKMSSAQLRKYIKEKL